MPITDIQLDFPTLNTSLQIGDIAYYSHAFQNTGGFNNTALNNTRMLGPITQIIDLSLVGGSGFALIVQYDSDDHPAGSPAQGDYISFVKDKKANTSSLLGYYAEVNFVNYETGKIELFSVGSEVSESSK
jgi:hypothetical protein